MVRPIINSEKKIIQFSLATAAFGLAVTKNIALAKTSPTVAVDVAVGSVIKAVYLELWVMAESAQPGATTVILEKLPGVGTNITAAEMAALDDYNNKKNIFFTTQGLVGDSNTNPSPLIRQWIKIPKSKQRFGLTDRLQFTILGLIDNIEFCGLAIYKVYN